MFSVVTPTDWIWGKAPISAIIVLLPSIWLVHYPQETLWAMIISFYICKIGEHPKSGFIWSEFFWKMVLWVLSKNWFKKKKGKMTQIFLDYLTPTSGIRTSNSLLLFWFQTTYLFSTTEYKKFTSKVKNTHLTGSYSSGLYKSEWVIAPQSLW